MYRRRSSERGRKVTPPSPTYMNNDQFAAYLADLRNNRVARPGGARPLPPSSTSATVKHTTAQEASSQSATKPTGAPLDIDPSLDPSHERNGQVFMRPSMRSAASRHSIASTSGSYQPADPARSQTKLSEVVASATYMERGQRWMEREEVGSLRHAMEDMNLAHAPTEDGETQDEQRIYEAALNEASELVWQHRNGGQRTPEPHAPYRYKPHMRKNSYQQARAASISKGSAETRPSNASTVSQDQGSVSVRSSLDGGSRQSVDLSRNSTGAGSNNPRTNSPHAITAGGNRVPMTATLRRSSMKRNISGEIEPPFSGDQIWEEPEVQQASASPSVAPASADVPLVDKARNPQRRLRSLFEKPQGYFSPFKTRSSVEIHRNPPSQSHNPSYTRNAPVPSPEVGSPVPKRNGVEVRGEDIREATSMKLKDRSAKLPTPSAVSDNPGRPIVSFDAGWKPAEETADEKSGSVLSRPPPEKPSQNSPAMVIPTIVVAEEPQAPGTPSIVVEDTCEDAPPVPSIPVIITPEDVDSNHVVKNSAPATADSTARPAARPLPSPGSFGTRQARAPQGHGHWSPSPGHSSRSGTPCHQCGHAIEGRFVALAGIPHRFHPRCFSCYVCGTGLEALEISPEPEAARKERLDRIQQRARGEVLEEIRGKTMAEDGDDRLRFYCHLDWHELFAPRCKHCTTPILGEHIVALGQHWHYGHFFCAECGDPFEKGMTHIEKDGYAWCINCQTKRTERRAPKCKMCRKAVIGQYLRALGGEWHEECFRCAHCQGGFDDGQIFPKEEQGRMVVLCTDCRMRDLKA